MESRLSARRRWLPRTGAPIQPLHRPGVQLFRSSEPRWHVPRPRLRRHPGWPDAIGLALALSTLSSVLISIALALFIALGLDPVVRSLQARGVPRGWAIVIVSVAAVLVFLGVLALIVPVVVQQLFTLIADIPATIDAFMASENYRRINETFGDTLSGALTQFEALLVDPGTIAAVGGGVFQVSVGIVGGVSGALIVFVLTLYFIVSLSSIKEAFYRVTPAWSRPQLADMTERVTQSVGSYLKGMVTLAFLNSVVVFVLHLALGLPFPALMAVGAFLLTMLGLLGALVAVPVTASILLIVSEVFIPRQDAKTVPPPA